MGCRNGLRLVGFALGLILLSGWRATALLAQTYKVDPVHSSVLFRVKHFDTGYFYGRFNAISGTIVFDKQNPSRSSVSLEVRAESVDTNDPKRDGHLKSPDFFNVRQFPVITFKSTSVKPLKANVWEVRGNFTLLGVTRPLTVQVTLTGEGKDPFGNYRVGFETTFDIKRSNFGMKYMLGPLSDEVRIILSVEGIRQ